MTEKFAIYAPLDSRRRPFWLTMPELPTMPRVRSMLLTSGFITLAVALGVSSAGVSYATWVDSEPVSGGTITAGTLDLTIADSVGNDLTNSTLSGVAWSQLLPGDVVSQQVSVTNTGTTPLALTVSTSPSTVINVYVKSGVCSGTITGDSSNTTPTAVGAPLAGGASVTVCIQVSLTPTAVQNQSAPFTMTFTGDQVRP
ncbi:MAG: hypothetical protein ABIW32_03595 [Terrimesophilobacter sp.]